jgi:glycosyltransferase involved in cell wall biosynthesis
VLSLLYQSNYASLSRGGQKSLWYILRDLSRDRYNPVLVCQEEGELTERARDNGIPVEIIKLPRLRPWCLVSIIRCLDRWSVLIKKYDVNIIHTEELVSVVLLGILKPFVPIKIVWHVRVLQHAPFQKRVGLFFADRVVTVSDAVATTFPSSPHVVVAHNGIDLVEYTPGDYRVLSDHLGTDNFIIGYCGQLIDTKGVRVLIQAIPGVIKKYPNIQLLLIGTGNEKYVQSLMSLAIELKISDKIVFWGEEKLDMKNIMDRMDIFVFPSFTEGLSRSLLEAMALKKPIVASDIPSNAELVRHNTDGLLARTGDPDDLAAKIISLLDDPAVACQMGENARHRVAEKFTVQLTLAKICAVYDDLSFPGKRADKP